MRTDFTVSYPMGMPATHPLTSCPSNPSTSTFPPNCACKYPLHAIFFLWHSSNVLTLFLSLQLEAKGTVNSKTGDTIRREREEERRLLADTHTAAMDLRCRLEHSERDWVREKSELLERFDLERKEWESQLRDMQHKIEEVSLQMETKPRNQAATAQRSSK